jgi:hypothetical protein
MAPATFENRQVWNYPVFKFGGELGALKIGRCITSRLSKVAGAIIADYQQRMMTE